MRFLSRRRPESLNLVTECRMDGFVFRFAPDDAGIVSLEMEDKMKLSDMSHGPKWILWVLLLVLAIISIVLISGHGSWLVSGYNTAPKEEKEKYDRKKLCRVTGTGLGVVTVLIFFMGLFENVLPAGFLYAAIGIILADALLIVIGCNTICKK